ncbi:hypothetical protein VNI00_000709 [Paramarasmius palmivorus]|uniref:Uncharacterized protein n=1 Tax=Paramarasmius palmivorus TaxID=297713 RepID=A0AAW0E9W2_9AGAR
MHDLCLAIPSLRRLDHLASFYPTFIFPHSPTTVASHAGAQNHEGVGKVEENKKRRRITADDFNQKCAAGDTAQKTLMAKLSNTENEVRQLERQFTQYKAETEIKNRVHESNVVKYELKLAEANAGTCIAEAKQKLRSQELLEMMERIKWVKRRLQDVEGERDAAEEERDDLRDQVKHLKAKLKAERAK